MLLRAVFVSLSAALLLPLAGGTAHASCLDDFQATDFGEGYTESPKSEHWGSGRVPHSHVEQSGPATFTVYGDALVSDSVTWLTVDWPNFTTTIAANTAGATTEFVDCVAG